MIIVSKEQAWAAERHFRCKYTEGCHAPKKGQWFLKPTQKKRMFELRQAVNDHKIQCYWIVSPHAAERLLKLFDNG